MVQAPVVHLPKDIEPLPRSRHELEPECLVTRNNMAHRWRWKMRPTDQDSGFTIAFEKGPTGLTGLLGIGVSAHDPFRLQALHRAVNHIPRNHCLRPIGR